MDPWDLSCRPPRQPAPPATTSATHKAPPPPTSVISSQLLASISSSGYSSSSSTSSSSSSSYSSQTSTRSNSLDTSNGDGLLPLLASHHTQTYCHQPADATMTTHSVGLFQVATAQPTHSGQTELVATTTTTMTTTSAQPLLDRKERKKDQNRRAAYNYRRKKMEEKNRLREEEMRLVYSRVCLIGYADELEGTIMYILNTKTRKILDKDDVVRFLCPLCLQSCDNLMNLRGHLNVMHHFCGANNEGDPLNVVNDHENGDRSNNNNDNNNNNSC